MKTPNLRLSAPASSSRPYVKSCFDTASPAAQAPCFFRNWTKRLPLIIVFTLSIILSRLSYGQATVFENGFEVDTSGWFGNPTAPTRVPSGTGGVTSAAGGFHATVTGDGIFTRWGEYRSVFPTGGYTTSVKVYLDVSTSAANDTRFDYISAINNAAGSHRRDFAFNIGFYNSSDATGPGASTNRFVISTSNNAGRSNAFPKNPGRSPIAISSSGWYALEHRFQDNGSGVLEVVLSVRNAANTVVGTWTLSDPTDTIRINVGGNRYGWILSNEFSSLAIDDGANTFASAAAAPLVQNITKNWRHSTIQNAITQASSGDEINVSPGTFDEQITVNKPVTIKGVGVSKPIINFTGTVSGKPTLIDVQADHVTLQNLELDPDLKKLSSAIIASAVAPSTSITGLQLLSNLITPYASSTGASFGSFGNRNAISINYGGSINYRVTGGGGDVTVTSNTIAGRPASDALANGSDRFFRSGVSIDECSGTFDGNTIQTISHDILVRFGSTGTVQIQNNHFNGSGVQLSEQNAGVTALNVVNNFFDGTAAQAFSGTAVLRLQNNQTGIPTTVSGNTFTNHNWGISAENYKNLSIASNSFTPAAVSYRHITINTKSLTSNSPSIVQTTISASITGNTFNDSSPSAPGTAVAFYNHDSDNAAFGTFTLTGNVFNAGIATFIKLDNSTGGTLTAPSFPEYAAGNLGSGSNTIMAPWTPNIDATANTFDTGTGAKLPSVMSTTELFSLANLIFDSQDASTVGTVRVLSNALVVTAGGVIQTAINAASPGDTVIVGPGTYLEDVTINKTLTLLGSGCATTTISGVIGGSGATVAIAANNVVVEGFTITREGNNTTDWNNPGLNVIGLGIQGAFTGAVVRNNCITGNRNGIDINNSSGHSVLNNIITNNRTGMILRNQTDALVIEQNEITNNWTVGILFLDGSGGTNSPPQSANGSFFNNNISGNWYAQIADRQSGGSLPAPGTNKKNFSANWFGSTTPVITTANTTEPGYAAQIPVVYGGTATAPGGQPDIAGPASANFDITPLLVSGTDTNVETSPSRGTLGFQGDFAVLKVLASMAQTGSTGRVSEAVGFVTAGGSVTVTSGTYIDDVTVNKTITLTGAGYATTTISGAIGGSGATLALTANNVIVEGFTITREGNNTTDWNNPGLNSIGLAIQGAFTGAIVRNNCFTGNRNGIDINNSSGHSVLNNIITNNRTGMILRNQTDALVIEQNEITNNWTIGVLFLDGSGGTNSPPQSASGTFLNNNISGNWYGQIVDRQTGGSLPTPGSNVKNFSGNWLGSATPVITSANSTEPGYAAQIPVIFGGTAAAPGGQPDIAGPASANFDITPLLVSGTDTDVETSPSRGTMGFQGSNVSLRVTADLAQADSTTRIEEGVNALAAVGTLAVATGSYTGNVDTSTKTVELSAGASPGQVSVTGNFTLDSNDTLPVEINGLTPGTGFDQWVVNGTVNLGGATLSLAGTYTPTVGNSFVIVDNDGTDPVTGTFSGLPDNSIFTFNGVSVRISYAGGTGNDVVITFNDPDIQVQEGVNPILVSGSGSVDFGSRLLGYSTTKTFTISNTGLNDLSSLVVSKTGTDSSSFSFTAPASTTLAPSGTTTITITFAPVSDGPKTAAIHIASNDPDENPFIIPVTGIGLLSAPVITGLGDVTTNSLAPDAAGGSDGTQFNVIGRGGYLAANGVLGFPATLKIGGSVTMLNNQGYWKDDGSGMKRLVRSSDVMPGTNGASLDALPTIPVPGINSVGQVTLLGTLRIGTGTVAVTAGDDTAMWSEVGGNGLQLLARENDPVTGVSGAFIGSFGFGCYATATTGVGTGEAAFTIKMKGSTTQSALIRRSITGPGVGTNVIIAREASAAPGVAGQNFGPLNSALTNSVRMDPTGNLVFEAQMKPNNKFGIWYQPIGSSVSKVFVANDTAPGTSNATFGSFDLPSMGSGGTFAFHAVLNRDGDNATNAKNSGIWRGTGTGAFTPILRRGDPALPGMVVGSKVGNLWNGWLNLANHGAWKGWVDTAGDGISPYPADTFGIYTDIGGTMRLLISAGDSAPGIVGTTIISIDHPVVSGNTVGSEYVAFLGTVTGGGVTAGVNDKGVWRSANGAAPTLILRTGDAMTTSQGSKTIFDIDIPGSNQDVRPWEQSVMDDTGRILMIVTFTDGSTAQVIAL